MEYLKNFRDFEAGLDPFGRKWHVLFKYLQTGISIRHSDSVDICFILNCINDDNAEKNVRRTVVLRNPDLRAWAKAAPGRKISDPFCSRVAMCKIRHAVETAEDLEKEYLVVTPEEIERYGALVDTFEANWVKKNAA